MNSIKKSDSITKYVLTLLLLVTAVFLSQCRYHLRGTGNNDPVFSQTRFAIHSKQPNSPFMKTLQTNLHAMGTQLIDESIAQVIVQIHSTELSQHTLAVSSNTQIHTVSLSFRVTYQLSNVKGEPLTPIKEVSASQIFSSDDNQMLGASHEKWQIERALHQEISYQLVNQLRAFVADRPNPVPTIVAEPAGRPHTQSQPTPAPAEPHHAR